MPGKCTKFTITLVIISELPRDFISVIFKDHCLEAVV